MAETVIAPSGGGAAGSGAPTSAEYLVRVADATLSAERVVTDTATVTWDFATPGQAKANAVGSGTGDVVGPAGAVDGEVALYSGVTGKLLKRATGTGITRALSGVYVTPSELSGDVTTSGSNAVTIAPDAVTYAKMQNISAASLLLGRGSAGGAGDPQEIVLGTNLSMSGTTLNAAGGSSSDVVVVLAADLPHATFSTVLSNITGFVVPTTASPTEIWRVECLLVHTSNTAAGSSADFKFQWVPSGGQTGVWSSQIEREVSAATPAPLAPAITTPLIFGGASNVLQGMIAFHALIASNGVAGTVQLQWAQNAAGAAGAIITLKRMSLFIARKVAA